MAKRFFYVAAGLFLLVAAYQLGVQRADADWSGAGWVVGTVRVDVLNALGEAYRPVHDGTGPGYWLRDAIVDLPVSPADVKCLGENMLVTQADVVWLWVDPEWVSMPPVPGGPVSVEGQSFGATKAKYR